MPNNQQILEGGVIVIAKFDPTTKGEKPEEKVLVKILKLRQLREYGPMMAANDEAGQIELFTGKDAEWVDSLAHDSAVQILKEGQELNRDFFVQWAGRMTAVSEVLKSSLPPLPPPTSPPK